MNLLMKIKMKQSHVARQVPGWIGLIKNEVMTLDEFTIGKTIPANRTTKLLAFSQVVEFRDER